MKRNHAEQNGISAESGKENGPGFKSIIKKVTRWISIPFVFPFHYLKKGIKSFRFYLTEQFKIVKRYFKALSKVGGFRSKIRFIKRMFSYMVRTGRLTIRHILNYMAPIAAVAFFVFAVQFFAKSEYVLAVNYDGQTIGYVASEADYNEAAELLNGQIINVNNENINTKCSYSLIQVDDETKVIDSTTLVDRIINESDTDITKAVGLYVNNTFYGAVEDSESIENAMADLLENYQAKTGTVDASFKDDVTFKEGIYSNSNIVKEEELLSLITSDNDDVQVYTAEAGDSLDVIAEKTNVSVTELQELNPSLSEEVTEGQAITVSPPEPFLSVAGYKEIQYEETVEYQTVVEEDDSIYENDSKVTQEGANGLQNVTARVQVVDGKEVSREILETEVITAPVDKIVIQGTKNLPEGATFISAASGTNTLSGISFIRPLQGAGTVSRGITRTHSGVDWAAPEGTPIYAAASGTVSLASWYSGYGNCVIVDHGNGVQTLYGHMVTFGTTLGAEVAKGQLIGYVGTTGRSTGNHLHFEIRNNGTKLDPFDYVSR